MSWFKRLLGMEKSQNPQESTNEPKVKNESNKQGLSAVWQAILEEAITAITYWVITLVKQGLESKKNSQVAANVPPPQEPVANRMTGLEELLPKVTSLIEQLSQRNQAMIALENRIGAMEKLLEGDSSSATQVEHSSQVMTALENRIAKVENLVVGVESLTGQLGQFSQSVTALESRMAEVENLPGNVESLTGQLGQFNQGVSTLESRIAKVENVLGRFSIIPQLVDQQGRVLASLHSRIMSMESSQPTNQKDSSEDRVLAKVSQTDSAHCCKDLQST